MQDSLTGQLLVASSTVTDPMYAGGVCLIVHQDESTLIGMMLNRPMKPSPEALQLLGNAIQPGESDGSDESGGPMEPMIGQDDAVTNGNRLCDADETAAKSAPDSPWRMLHFGGPLSGPVVAIHPNSQFGELETGEGIFVAAQIQHLEHLVRRQAGPCRLIVGHLSWQPEELADQIQQGIWHLVPATAETVFSAADEMWPRLIRRATSNSLARWIGTADLVEAGELN